MKRLLTVFVILMLASSVMPIAAVGDAPFPTKDWAVSTPEEQGISSKDVLSIVQTAAEDFYLDGLVIVRNGYIIAEGYSAPFTATHTVELHEATKMVMALAIGRALEEGLIKTVQEPMISFYPERIIQNLDERKKAITLEHLLTMTSGLTCNDKIVYSDFLHDTTPMITSKEKDWVQATLDLPMGKDPGESFNWCNAVLFILVDILGKVSGMPPLRYIDQHLLKPLGISEHTWTSSEGRPLGFEGLQVTTRDAAKFGYLLLKKGRWEDQQLIPVEYAEKMLTPIEVWDIDALGRSLYYSYFMITDSDASFIAGLCFVCQNIVIFPTKDLVTVLTGSSMGVNMPGWEQSITISDTALPDNPDELGLLRDYLESLSNPTPVPVPPLRDIATKVSGIPYELSAPNLFYPDRLEWYYQLLHPEELVGINTVTLTFPGKDTATLSLDFTDKVRLDIPIGLDGVYRTSPWRHGEIAARGQWFGKATFLIEMRLVGTGLAYRLEMKFPSGKLLISVYESGTYTSGRVEGVPAAAKP